MEMPGAWPFLKNALRGCVSVVRSTHMQTDPSSVGARPGATPAATSATSDQWVGSGTTAFDRTAESGGLSPIRTRSTSYVTGAYLASGDPSIDRMVALELALKRHGSAF
jgi:hypothetical protein